MSDLWLFFLVLAKVGLYCGFAPAIAIVILYEKFGTGALRPEQSGSGHMLGSNPRSVSDSLSAGSKTLRARAA